AFEGAWGRPVAQHRYYEHAAESDYSSGLTRELEHPRLLDVWHVDDRPRQDRSANCGFAIQGPGVRRPCGGRRLWRPAISCRKVQQGAVGQDEPRPGRMAELGGAAYDGVEYRLGVGLGMHDASQDLAGRRLLVPRLTQLVVTCLELPQRLRLTR